MKKRKQKAEEYDIKYNEIPRDFQERLYWMHDHLHVTDKKEQEILDKRDRMLNSLQFQEFFIVLYEEPEGTPRPRVRLVNRTNIANEAMANSSFIQVYSLTGRQNREYMKQFTQSNLSELETLLCTPCDIEYRSYFPTPKYYNKTQIFLAEIGLDRPVAKPDFDNIEKAYGDSFTGNIWIDDILVVDAIIRKYYSVLPRVEIDLMYSNQLYNIHQYKAMIKRKDYTEEMNVQYFGG